MSVLLFVDFEAKPETKGELIEFLKGAVAGVRAADGCEGADLWVDDATGQPRLVETWVEKAKSEAHLAKLAEAGVLGKVAAICTRPPNLHYHDKLS